MRFPTFLIELPLVDENGLSKGSMWRTPRHMPKHLPRVGESLYVLPEIALKVQEIKYSGFHYNWVNLRLEPIEASYRNSLETQPSGKRDERWKWRAKSDD